MTSFYTRHKHINNEGHGGDGVLAAVCVFLSHTKQREEKRMTVTLLLVFKHGGFDSCVGWLMTLPATTLLTNQRPAV